MNILQVHGIDAGTGGGPIAMLRLQEGLRKAGVHSRILCPAPAHTDSVAIPRVRLEGRLRAVCSRLGLNEVDSLGAFRVRHLPAYADADLLHLHCLHGGFFNYLTLPRLTKAKPAIYTLHDMWPFTGHCVHSFDCERWESGCGRCPYPQMPNAVRRDATWWEWKLKNWSYRRSNLTIVVPSTWMYRLARRSMLKDFHIQHIPHGVDTDMYKPLDPEVSRAALGIPPGKKVLLYMVRRMDPSHRVAWMKGADLLVRAVQQMPASLKRETMLLLVGEGGEALARKLDIAATPLGFVVSDRLKALVCSAADLLVLPSRAETFGLVLIESMACGTPAVAFSVGGVTDLVRPGITGFLAEPEDAKGLSEGIVQLLEDANARASLRLHCREIAVKEYHVDLYVNRHIALYQDALQSVAA